MLACLPALLEGAPNPATKKDEPQDATNDSAMDEEKIESFTKLMTTMGSTLEQQSKKLLNSGKPEANRQLEECWAIIRNLANSPGITVVTNRTKFMLQDLMEMRRKGWVQRRKLETAKTIAEIHDEVAAEEAKSGSNRRMSRTGSHGSMSRMQRAGSSGSLATTSFERRKSSSVETDADGWSTIKPVGGIKRTNSEGGLRGIGRGPSDGTAPPVTGRRASTGSGGGAFAVLNDKEAKRRERRKRVGSGKSDVRPPTSPSKEKKGTDGVQPPPLSSDPPKQQKTPKETEEAAVSALKEFFVGGDRNEAILCFKEIVDCKQPGPEKRTTYLFYGACCYVIEQKETEVAGFIDLLLECLDQKIIVNAESIIAGIHDVLEILADVAIDAPLATVHMAAIVASLIRHKTIGLTVLSDAPEYFRTDGDAAKFGAKVLKKLGASASSDEANLKVIEGLMTEKDQDTFTSVPDLIATYA